MLPKVQHYLAHDEVILVKSHLCRFGLRARERLNRKATLFAGTCGQTAAELQRLCRCNEPHQRLESGLPREAQTYPLALVKAIIDGLPQEWLDQQQGRPSIQIA